MNKIHPMSVPATKSELDLFIVPSTQMVITGNQTQWHLPISDITNAAKRIEFNIPPMQDFIDLSSLFLYVKFNVRKDVHVQGQGIVTQDLEDADQVLPSQYFLNTMFNQVELYLGNKRVTSQSPYYNYKAYFDGLFFSTNEAKQTYMRSALWDKDANRITALKKSKDVELYGRIHLDLCQQDKLLIPAVPIRLVFTLNNDKINFEVATGANQLPILTPKMNLKDIRISLRKYLVDDSAKLGIESALQTADAKYFITRSDIHTGHIPISVEKHTIDNFLKSVLPRLFIIGVISNNNLAGKLTTDAYKFATNKVKYIAAYKGGVMLNGTAFTPDYAKGLYFKEYTELYRALCQDNSEPIMSIAPEDFKNHMCFYAFNLTPDSTNQGANDGTTNLLQTDNIRLDIEFTEPTTEPMNVVCYSLYDNHIAIDMNREIKTDY